MPTHATSSQGEDERVKVEPEQQQGAEEWEPQGTGGSVVQHPRRMCCTQVFPQPRAEIPTPRTSANARTCPCLAWDGSTGRGNPCSARCAARGLAGGCMERQSPQHSSCPQGSAWWDEQHPVPGELQEVRGQLWCCSCTRRKPAYPFPISVIICLEPRQGKCEFLTKGWQKGCCE